MIKVILVLLSLSLGSSVYAAKGIELQKNKGFVGYVEAGTTIEIKSVSMATQTLNFVDPANAEIGLLQATFKNFERSLGGNKKVEYLNKTEPLPGRTFVLKNNLVLKAL